MTDIVKYEILNPVIDKTKPFFRKGILFIPIEEKYRYFIEAAQENAYGEKYYFLLLSKTKFNSNCRICNTDMYGRVKIPLKGEIKDFVENKTTIDIEYIESGEDYDVFSII